MLAGRIGRNTTLSKSDIVGVLVALEEEIVDILKMGSYVELGQFCTFYPAIKKLWSRKPGRLQRPNKHH